MTFAHLAGYLQEFEKTASRNEITRILADLFKHVSLHEIDKVCYLVLGRIAPQYEGTEFNFAERMMTRAIALAYDKEPDEVLKSFKQAGDLGDVAFQIAAGSRQQTTKLSIEQVFNKLKNIALDSGKDSQERKLRAMAGLLNQADPSSAKFIARIPVGNLRLGFSDMTILDALSVMEKGDKSARKRIEAVFNVTADIGKVAQRVKQHGLTRMILVSAEPGVPIRGSLAERLASAEKITEKLGEKFAVEPKMDGFRCITGHTPIYVRDKGYISVKDIKVGDYVFTHKGRYKKVLAINKRNIDKGEKLFKFQTYFANSFKVSQGHRILVWRNNEARWVPVEKVYAGDFVVFPRSTVKVGKKNLFLPNPHLALRDTSGYSKAVQTNQEFYRFLGFWIGDGYTNNFHNTERIGLHFNLRTEETLSEEYKNIITKILGIPAVYESRRKGVLSLYWRDKPFREWLSTHFRREWKGKMLPIWFNLVGRENFLSFLKGWVESDGTQRNSGGARIVTKERDLACFAQLLAIAHGFPVGLRKIRNKISSLGFEATYYELIIPGTGKRVKVMKDKILVRILRNKEIKTPDMRTTLYNLQVEKDESYCTGMAALHNCQIHILEKNERQVKLFSRNLENVTPMFPEIVEAAKKFPVDSVIFDGEAIGYNPKTGKFAPFQETVQRKRKHGIDEMAKNLPLKVFVFDILYLNGETLLQEPFIRRREVLESLFAEASKGQVIMLTEQHIVGSAVELRKLAGGYLKDGLEGAMAKKLDVAYQPGGRGFHWVKYKKHSEALKGSELADTIDCVLMGAYSGRGRRTKFGVGGFLIGVPGKDEKYYTLTNLGTGLTDEQFRGMFKLVKKLEVKNPPPDYIFDKQIAPDIWVKPEVVLEILADEITMSPRHTAGREKSDSGDKRGYSLRFPRLMKIRDDKSPDQATSVHEVEELYKMQKLGS